MVLTEVSIGLGEVLWVDLTYELRARLGNVRYLRIPLKKSAIDCCRRGVVIH
jgi:hypothetical protein